MLESEKIEYGSIPLEPMRCPNCGGDDTDLDRLSGIWECFDCLNMWHYGCVDEPEDDDDELTDIAPFQGYGVDLPPGVTTLEGLARWCEDNLGQPPS